MSRSIAEDITTAKISSAPKKQQALSDLKHSDPSDRQLRKFRTDYLKMIEQRLLAQQREALSVVESAIA